MRIQLVVREYLKYSLLENIGRQLALTIQSFDSSQNNLQGKKAKIALNTQQSYICDFLQNHSLYLYEICKFVLCVAISRHQDAPFQTQTSWLLMMSLTEHFWLVWIFPEWSTKNVMPTLK